MKTGRCHLAKIPVIEAGMEAMAELIERNIPVCATECFSISQTIAMCELYESISKKTGKCPPFFITHITGIFDEELKAYIERKKTDTAPELVHQADCIVARKEYRVIKERRFRTTLLCGGARGTHHFTEFVGGDVHVTLNWNTIKELNDANGPVISRIDIETPQEVIDELCKKLPYFQKAYYEDGLTYKEFKKFAPLQQFRNSFLKGWDHLLKEIKERR